MIICRLCSTLACALVSFATGVPFSLFGGILSFVIPGRGPRATLMLASICARPANRNPAAIRTDNVFYVYLLASRKQGTLYLGVTRDLVCRIYQHREKLTPGFTSR